MSFDEIFDLTAGVYFHFFYNVARIGLFPPFSQNILLILLHAADTGEAPAQLLFNSTAFCYYKCYWNGIQNNLSQLL